MGILDMKGDLRSETLQAMTSYQEQALQSTTRAISECCSWFSAQSISGVATPTTSPPSPRPSTTICSAFYVQAQETRFRIPHLRSIRHRDQHSLPRHPDVLASEAHHFRLLALR